MRVPEREWIGELQGMEQDGTLGAFLGGIEAEKSAVKSPPSGLPPVVVPPSGRGRPRGGGGITCLRAEGVNRLRIGGVSLLLGALLALESLQ